jgi:plasmid stabilization system protein ParE
MADTHRVILAADALADLEAIADYIHQSSPQNAATVAERILSARAIAPASNELTPP